MGDTMQPAGQEVLVPLRPATLTIGRGEWVALALILVVYGLLAWQYAVRVPDWQAPDEPAHYNYVRQIADEGRLPVLEMGDWQQDYQNALVGSGFDPALTDRIDTLEYEDHQPPLYYLLQAPVYAASDGDLVALRLFSALIGAGVVLAAWATLRALFPRWPALALTGAAFMAFLPQHVSILASVSNDSLAELLVGLTLLASVRYLDRTQPRPPIALGLLVGAALLTKTTIYFLAGIAGLAVLLRWRRARWPLREAAGHIAAVLIPAVLLGGLWWARNLDVYGGTDFTGLARHDAVTVGQPRTDDYIETMYGGSTRLYLENYARTTFRSFWGQFGWMGVVMAGWTYTLFLLFAVGVVPGAILFAGRHSWPRGLTPAQRESLFLFGIVLALVLAAYVLYNLDFVQFQGRYLYPALVPLALLAALGLRGWVDWLAGRWPVAAWLPVAAMFALAAFAWYALDTYIVPTLPAW
ncbi:MAG: glycosyltransferase family 39 protein [Chloroflexi bacterium]|nr:glycosyltransferase family 39 protein [Chloroflexota bacterium]